MAINEFKCHQFRNLKNTNLKFNTSLNIITGTNGSGKSSILEAIYILSTSKSFRSKYLKSCIQFNHEDFILYGKFDHHTVGIKRDNNKLTSKINNKLNTKISVLAKYQPVLLIDHQSFDLINGGPSQKREFLDWALFHVKHEFSSLWINYKNILKQRNALLRKKDISNIQYWDNYLIQYNDKIDEFRKQLINDLFIILKSLFKDNELFNKVSIDYQQGWSVDKTYKQALKEKIQTDLKRGFTGVGTHKCDIQFSVKGKNIKEIFSRGQQKKFIINLYVILMEFVTQHTKQKPIFIVDDLASELDQNSFKDVIVSLLEKDYQLFITNINNVDYLDKIQTKKTMFHVKHGEINY